MTSHHFVAVFLATIAISTTSRAADGAWTLRGDGIRIEGPCAAGVTITPGEPGTTEVSVRVHADHPEEIARLAFDAAEGGPRLHPSPADARCWRPDGARSWQPTLTVAAVVPRGARIAIEDGGVSAYRIGAVGGALTAELSGHATLDDAATAGASLELSGATRVALGRVAGATSVDASGDSTIRIDEIAAPSLTLGLSGSYDVGVGGGSVGALEVDASGAGRITVGGTTGSAKVEASGMPHVRIARLTGPIERDISGLATVDTGP